MPVRTRTAEIIPVFSAYFAENTGNSPSNLRTAEQSFILVMIATAASRALKWFLACLNKAIAGAQNILATVLRKAEFWQKHAATPFNERQRNIVNHLLDGFVGKLTSSKWAKLENTSPDTALRNINDLVARGILKRDKGGGRSTSYSLGPI